jgi:hypothetical protein
MDSISYVKPEKNDYKFYFESLDFPGWDWQYSVVAAIVNKKIIWSILMREDVTLSHMFWKISSHSSHISDDEIYFCKIGIKSLNLISK